MSDYKFANFGDYDDWDLMEDHFERMELVEKMVEEREACGGKIDQVLYWEDPLIEYYWFDVLRVRKHEDPHLIITLNR